MPYWFLGSGAQSCMHYETICDGLIVREVNPIACYNKCGILAVVIDIVDKSTERCTMEYFTVHMLCCFGYFINLIYLLSH